MAATSAAVRTTYAGSLRFPPVRLRGKIRGVRFDEQTFQWNLPNDFTQFLRLIVCDRAGNGDIKSHFEATLGHGGISGKTVDYTTPFPFQPFSIETVLRVGIPVMDDQRQIKSEAI